jgi:hypothetical protein
MDHPRHVARNIALACALTIAVVGCPEQAESESETQEGAEEGTEEKKVAVGEVVLEEVDVKGLGKVLLPKGRKDTLAPTDKRGNYTLALSKTDRNKVLYVDWEANGGATTVAAADKLVVAVIGSKAVVKTKKDLGDGRVKYVATRDDGYTFTVVFNAKAYLKCWGPDDQADNCSKVAESLDPIEGTAPAKADDQPTDTPAGSATAPKAAKKPAPNKPAPPKKCNCPKGDLMCNMRCQQR